MSVIEVNKNPSRRDLMIFGLLFLAFTAIVGALFEWRTHAPGAARGVQGAGPRPAPRRACR